MGGTLTIRHAGSWTPLVLLRRGARVSVGSCVSGTLLGPEGAAVMVGSSVPAPVNSMAFGCGGDGWLVVA
jgi:hypothetical protein